MHHFKQLTGELLKSRADLTSTLKALEQSRASREELQAVATVGHDALNYCEFTHHAVGYIGKDQSGAARSHPEA